MTHKFKEHVTNEITSESVRLELKKIGLFDIPISTTIKDNKLIELEFGDDFQIIELTKEQETKILNLYPNLQ